ncbi:MAG TPA: hypothetical protein VM925_21875 [Labilithrix sp.]|nr:hypothetical protein [Labilithrix sp.]
MRDLQKRSFRALLATTATAAVIACTYGNYDGSYSGGADGGAEAASGTIVVTRTIDPNKDEVLTTPDGAFEVTIPTGAFAKAQAITISQLEDRTVDALIVPTYTVTASEEPKLPLQIVFRGNNPNGSSSRLLFVAERGEDGTFVPLVMNGLENIGGTNRTLWGLTRKLGTFSVVFESITASMAFQDVSPASCIAKCCSGAGGNITNANGLGLRGGCACGGGPNLACFLASCPDLDAVASRCTDLGTHNPPVNLSCRRFGDVGKACPGQCGPYPGSCNAGTGSSICCVQNASGTCTQSGSGPGGQCSGIAIRCDLDTKCPAGTSCCVFDNDAYCTASCPTNRRPCRQDSDCNGGVSDAGADGGACQSAPACPFNTCGTPPASCL